LTAGIPSVWAAGLRLRCPQCGEGEVFQSYLKLRERCRACGADFRIADAGDGPAVFVILAVGAVATPFIFVMQALGAPVAVALGVTLIVAIGLSLALLPPFKATLFALQWKHKAGEATHADLQ
jgi:uncharacterized protein (DUF983 family)